MSYQSFGSAPVLDRCGFVRTCFPVSDCPWTARLDTYQTQNVSGAHWDLVCRRILSCRLRQMPSICRWGRSEPRGWCPNGGSQRRAASAWCMRGLRNSEWPRWTIYGRIHLQRMYQHSFLSQRIAHELRNCLSRHTSSSRNQTRSIG
jgi:hypothetical protein